jgi:phage-related minor tail protein
VDETINQFKRLKEDPVNAVATLNESLHFLTASQFEQISAAQAMGIRSALPSSRCVPIPTALSSAQMR